MSGSPLRRGLIGLAIAGGVAAFVLPGMFRSKPTPAPVTLPAPAAPAAAATTLTVLAGSEVKDLEPLLPQIRAATGLDLKFTYTGSLDAIDRLQSGERFDLLWLANNRYALLVEAARARIIAQERIMSTPVLLGLKESKARELGWAGNANVSWADIARAAAARKFTFAMTNPATSNTGFSALLGLAAALSGKSDAIEAGDVKAKELAAFFGAQTLTAGSSGWLAEAYVREQDRIDGLVNYANVLLLLNREGKLREKLVLVTPKDGVISADYPLMLLDAAKRPAYDKLVTFLRGAEFQKAMQAATLRRPINPDVAVDPAVAALGSPIELPFPARREVVDTILQQFDNALRKPGDVTFVLDTSGSMRGTRIDLLKRAMTGLLDADGSIGGRYAKFRERERVAVLPFSDRPYTAAVVEIGTTEQANRDSLAKMAALIANLNPQGGTAIFDSARAAYTDAIARRRQDSGRLYSIVLFTDGENTHGMGPTEFERWYRGLPADQQGIRIFTVLFGEAKPVEMQMLADLTGGRVFDGRSGNLGALLREIRGYQ